MLTSTNSRASHCSAVGCNSFGPSASALENVYSSNRWGDCTFTSFRRSGINSWNLRSAGSVGNLTSREVDNGGVSCGVHRSQSYFPRIFNGVIRSSGTRRRIVVVIMVILLKLSADEERSGHARGLGRTANQSVLANGCDKT